MRLLLLVLAIVLLPLRGWLGEPMMLAPVQQAASMHQAHAMHAAADHESDADATHTTPTTHTTHATHPAHATDNHAACASPGADAAHEDGDSAHPAHSTCDNCQFCHSVAMTAWPDVPMPAQAPAAAPMAEAIGFASAEAAQGLKPPIS